MANHPSPARTSCRFRKVQAEINVNGNVIADDIKEEHNREKEQIKASFYRSLEQIKEEFANEITLTTETMQAKHKKEMGEERSITLIINYKAVIYTRTSTPYFHPSRGAVETVGTREGECLASC